MIRILTKCDDQIPIKTFDHDTCITRSLFLRVAVWYDVWWNGVTCIHTSSQDILTKHPGWRFDGNIAKCLTRWWFQLCLYFHPYLRKWSKLTSICSNGLVQPLVEKAKEMEMKKKEEMIEAEADMFFCVFSGRWVVMWVVKYDGTYVRPKHWSRSEPVTDQVDLNGGWNRFHLYKYRHVCVHNVCLYLFIEKYDDMHIHARI